MTTKHFNALAETLRLHDRFADDKFTDNQLRAICDFCRAQNPAFDYGRFMNAVKGVDAPTLKRKQPKGGLF